MTDAYREYLELLDAMGEGLDQLSALSEKKIEAVRKDDLMALDEIMKQEQALALAFRGIEQSQEKLMGQLGWREVSLSKTAERFPPELQGEAVRAVQALQGRYQAYRSISGSARESLEGGIREIDGMIAGLGGAPAPQAVPGPGNGQREDAVPPQSMKTDFRA